MTTLITPDGDGWAPGKILQVAKAHFEETGHIIDQYRKSLRTGGTLDPAELKKHAHDLKAVSLLYHMEASRLAAKLDQQSEIVRDYAIDFGAARDEIKRRMACLRAARSSREIPE